MVGWQWGTWPAVVAAIVSVAVLAAQQLTTQDGLGAVGYLTRAAVFGTVAFLAGALAGRRQNIRLPLNPSAVVLEPSTHPPVDLTTPDPADVLTQRELEVLGMMAVGSTNAEIAERLVISQSTVKSHVKSILRKLGVRNRTEAVSRFLRR